MKPYTLIEKLSGKPELAASFTLLVLNRMLAEMPTAVKVSGVAELSVGTDDEIDVYVDVVEASTVRTVLKELNAGQVEFCRIDLDGRPASLLGRTKDTDRLRIFVDGRNTLRLNVLSI